MAAVRWPSSFECRSCGQKVPLNEPVKISARGLVDEPFDPDRAPDLFEAVLAWRGWAPTLDGHLTAAAQGGIWDPGVNRAVCNRYNHPDIPAVDCACGFYGWHRPEDVRHGELRGCFKAWGEIISHDVGIRSEFAEIIVLYDAEQIDTSILARIAERYKVPIMGSQAEALAYALDHGVAVPMDKRGTPKIKSMDGSPPSGAIEGKMMVIPSLSLTKSQVLLQISADTKRLMEELQPIQDALNQAIQSMSQAMIATGVSAREAREAFFKMMEADRKAQKQKKILSAEQRKKLARKARGE